MSICLIHITLTYLLDMDAKLICLATLLIMGFATFVDSKPTCPECVAAAPPAEGEGGEGEEGEDDPCTKAPEAWKNFFSWLTYCKDGTIGATKNPIGKIGSPTEEPAKGGE